MKITNKHICVVKRLIEDKLTQKKIGEECQVGERTIRNWLKKPEFLKLCDELCSDYKRTARLIANRWSFEAVKTLTVKLRSKSDEVARKAAVALLKMAGVKPKEAGDSVGGNLTITTIEKKLDGKK